MHSNLRPHIVEEADRWERVVESGFRDLGLERLVREGVEQKSRLNHVDDPMLVKRHDRMLDLKACLQAKEFGKPRRLVLVDEDSDVDDAAPVKTSKKKKRKPNKSCKSPSALTNTTTTKKKKKKSTTKKVSFTPEVIQLT